jgi:hypothetical protein
MATVFVTSEEATLAVLTKRNYKKVLGAIYKASIDLFISKIRKFELFKQFTKIKMTNSLRHYFIEQKFQRGSYLFR